MTDPRNVAMVFSGGLGLAAYHAGGFQAFSERGMPLHWVAGSSAGAATAALIAGNAPGERVSKLHAFWNSPPPHIQPSALRHAYGWMGAARTRLFGSAGHFHPRVPDLHPRFRSMYDLAPMRERLSRLVDFDRLNGGDVRICIAATDLETGAPVIFDSQQQRIELDHVMASCGFLPEFVPVEIDGRMLADGGLSLNAPFDPVLEADLHNDLDLYVLDLFARDGARPLTMEAAAERKSDLMFGNQTVVRLQYAARLRKLRQDAEGSSAATRVTLLSYRPGLEEAGPEKSFDLSATSLAQRWNAGLLDMQQALSETTVTNDILMVRRKDDATRVKAAAAFAD